MICMLISSRNENNKNLTSLIKMIPNPVSSPKNITQMPQPTEVTEEEPLYVNAKQVRIFAKFKKFFFIVEIYIEGEKINEIS